MNSFLYINLAMDLPMNTSSVTNERNEKKLKECERRGTKTLEFSNNGLDDVLLLTAFNLQHVQV